MVCREMFERARSGRRGFDRGFLYEQKYKLADVMRLLDWSDEMNGQNVGGYFCHKASGTMPIFVKYANSQYDDRFLGLLSFVKSRWTCSAVDLDTVGVQVGRYGRLVGFLGCCLFHE